MKKWLFLLILGCFLLLTCGMTTAWADWVYTWERTGSASSLNSSISTQSYYYDGISSGKAVFRTLINDKHADGKQNYATLYCECKEPPQTIVSGETVSLEMSLHGNISRCDMKNGIFLSYQIFFGDAGLDRAGALASGYNRFDDESGDSYPFKTYSKTGTFSETSVLSESMPTSTTEGETISIYFVNNIGMMEWKYKLKKTAEGEPASGRGDTGFGSASDTSLQPDSSCTFDVVSDSENPGYYVKPEYSEYTIDLNASNQLARIHYVISSYTENKYFSVAFWTQNGKSKYLELNDYDYGELKFYDDGVYTRSGYFEVKGVACGKTVMEFYVQDNSEESSKFYNRKFVTVNVIDSSQTSAEEQAEPDSETTVKKGTVLKNSSASYKVLDGLKNVSYTAPAKKTLTKAVVPTTVKINGTAYKVASIAANAFKGMKKLTTVTIGKNVTSIGANAFSGCKALTKVSIGAGVKTIGKNAFLNCVKLKTVSGGKGLTTIGASAFSGCKLLSKITLYAKVKKIGAKAFYKCSKLKTITVKTSKLTSKTVGANAFKGIYGKATIKVPKAKLKAYTTLLKKKGIGKNVKVKK